MSTPAPESTDTEPTVRLARVEVRGLFGMFDHVIDLKLIERVTLIYGPNGVGKTLILRMIAALFGGDYGMLANVSFSRFHLVLSNNAEITVTRSFYIKMSPAGEVVLAGTLEIEFLCGEHRGRFNVALKRGDGPDHRRTDGLTLALRAFWARRRRSEDAPDPVARFRIPTNQLWEIERNDEDLDFTALRSQLRVYFIAAQRLFRPFNADPASMEVGTAESVFPMVWDVASRLQQQIGQAVSDYAEASQRADRTFPTRLVRRSDEPVDLVTIKARLEALRERRQDLQQMGLIEEDDATTFDVATLDTLSPAQCDVMALYVEDSTTKLNTFDPLADRLSLLLRILDARFLHKTVRADSKHGLVILDHRQQPIPLQALSSGEQHQLVLLCELLFCAPRGALLLIDEPEISQHVVWQKRFLPDLLEITRLVGIDALVATHSPFIVGAHDELTVPLDPTIDTADAPTE